MWVLTGDKLETARNIGFSTKLLSSSMDRLRVYFVSLKKSHDMLIVVVLIILETNQVAWAG